MRRRKKPHSRPGPPPTMQKLVDAAVTSVARETDVALPVAAAAVKHAARILPGLAATLAGQSPAVTDPRTTAGSVVAVGPGVGETVFDMTRAVIMHELTVARVDIGRVEDGGDGSSTEHAFALQIHGRINTTPDLATVLVVTEMDGLAAILAEILGLAARADVGDQLEAAIDARLAAAGLVPEGSTPG